MSTQQQNITALLPAITAALADAKAEDIIALTFGAPSFVSSVGDVYDAKDPTGKGANGWTGRRVASASVPLLVCGIPTGITFSATVYRDTHSNGEDYAVRASLPQGASKFQSAFSGDDQMVSLLKFHIAQHADAWLDTVQQQQRPSNTNTTPRLVIRKLASKAPEAQPLPTPPAVVAAAPAAPTATEPAVTGKRK